MTNKSKKDSVELDLTKTKPLCYDCYQKDIKTEINIDNDGNILNGAQLFFEVNGEKLCVFKCDSCFEKSKSLTHYQECEVYSRIVGYIRPVKQWNPAKVTEYNERKVFDISNEENNKQK